LEGEWINQSNAGSKFSIILDSIILDSIIAVNLPPWKQRKMVCPAMRQNLFLMGNYERFLIAYYAKLFNFLSKSLILLSEVTMILEGKN
jgi:hypothetical protein